MRSKKSPAQIIAAPGRTHLPTKTGYFGRQRVPLMERKKEQILQAFFGTGYKFSLIDGYPSHSNGFNKQTTQLSYLFP